MICSACQHSTDEHGLYGCTEGAEAELAALRAKAAIYDEAWQALPAWVTDACEPDHCGDLLYAIGLMREKARLFDWLAARCNVEWDSDIHTLFVTSPDKDLTSFAAPTLADAVRLAMDAEGR